MALGQGRDRTYLVGCLQPERVDDAIAALGVQHHELSSTRSKTYANIAGLLRTNYTMQPV